MSTNPISLKWYDAYGRVEAPSVVLLHGSVVSRVSWMYQIPELAMRYHVLTPDLPGHGALRNEPFTFERALKIVEELIIAEGNSRAVLIGISLGGHVATLLSANRPELIQGLAISGSSMDFHGAMGGYVRFAGWVMRKLLKSVYLKQQAEKSMRAKWPCEFVNAQLKAGIAPLGAAQSFAEVSQYDFQSALTKVTSPVLIMNGENDKPNRHSEIKFAEGMRDVRIQVVSGAGHACNIENPSAYNRLLLEFLDQCLPVDKPVERGKSSSFNN